MKIDHLIKRFIGDDDLKPTLKKAVRDTGRIIATNARILIAAPVEYTNVSLYEDISNGFPDWNRAIPGHNKENVLFTTSGAEIASLLDALPREDIGSECEECEGDGYFYTESGKRSVQYQFCEGEGETDVRVNVIPSYGDGNAKSSELYAIDIRGALFQPEYILSVALVSRELNLPMTWVVCRPDGTCLLYIGEILIALTPFLGREEAMSVAMHKTLTRIFIDTTDC